MTLVTTLLPELNAFMHTCALGIVSVCVYLSTQSCNFSDALAKNFEPNLPEVQEFRQFGVNDYKGSL